MFTKDDGRFYGEGDLFLQPEVAETLRQVADQGAAFMYTGSWADQGSSWPRCRKKAEESR